MTLKREPNAAGATAPHVIAGDQLAEPSPCSCRFDGLGTLIEGTECVYHAGLHPPAAPDVASMVKRLLEREHDTTCEVHQKRGYPVARSCDCTLSVRKEAAALLEALAGVDSGGRAQLLR